MSKKLRRQSLALTLAIMMIFTLFVSVTPKADGASDGAVETASETDASEVAHNDVTTEAEATDDIVPDANDGIISSSGLDLVGAPSDDALVIGMTGWDDVNRVPTIPTDIEDFMNEAPATIIYNEDAGSCWVVIGIYDAAEDKVNPISTDNIDSLIVTNDDDNDSTVSDFISLETYWDENGDEQKIFSLKCDQMGNYTLHYNSLELSICVSEDNGNGGEEVPEGLVIGWPWDDDGYGFEGRDVHKNLSGLSIKSNEWIILGIKSGDEINPITLDKLDKLTITDADGNDVSGVGISEAKDGYWDEETEEDVEFNAGDGIFIIYVETSGSYAITYAADDADAADEDTYTVYFDAGMPAVAAYSSETVSEDTLIGREVGYTPDTRTFYINKYDEVSEDGSWGTTRTITDYRFDNEELEEYFAAYISVEDTDNGYKVTLADNVIMEFSIIVKYTNKEYSYVDDVRYEDEEGWEDEAEIYFYYSGDDIETGGPYLDGAPQLGFSGNYVSEDSFKYGVYNDAIDGNIYYVHADTIQGVIDKLSEAAIGEAVPGYVMNEDGELELAANVNVINTGYISVQPSQGGNLVLEPQYVASSGNLNGIAFSDSANDYYVVADANYAAVTGHSGTDADYVELKPKDPALFIEWEQDKLTDAQITIFEDIAAAGDGFVDWKGKLYRVKRNENSYTTRDGIKVDDHYFTFAGTESFMDTPEEAMEDYLEKLENYLEGIDHGVDDLVSDFRRAELMPGLHVNLYCDMQFQGDMGELVIGYPDKSLTGGEYHSAVIEASGVEITGPDSYPTATEVHSSSKFNWGGISYDFRTYTIDSELDMAGTATGVTAVVPEPNALAQMSYEQKDAIEAGAKLTVDVTANEIDTAGTLDAETQTAVDSIVTATGKDASTIEFLDFTVDASVEGVSGSTNITETVVPINITITPKKPIDRNKKYRIARYHNGRVDYIDLVDSLYREVAGLNIGYVINANGTITFLADRFSVYALVDTEAEAPVEETPVTPTPAQVTTNDTPATPEAETPTQVTTNENNGVKTGDNTPFAVMLVLMLVSGVSVLAMNTRKIRKKK